MKTKYFICQNCGVRFKIPLWRFRDKGIRKYCSKSCRLEMMQGKNNWAWKGGIWRRDKKPIYWSIALDHYLERCNRCESRKDLQVHHKDRNRKNNHYSNLEFLCRSCHAKEHDFIDNLCPSNPSRCKTVSASSL